MLIIKIDKVKVVILAGGFGTRLSEYTQLIPKPMVEIGNKPILVHIMDCYQKYNFNDFIVATGYKYEFINSYFEEKIKSKNQEFNFQSGMQKQLEKVSENMIVKTVYSGLDAMTGGRLLAIEKYIDGEEFMLTYGDGLSNINLQKLLEYHRSHKKIATITAVRPLARFGILNIGDKNKVNCFKEKQHADTGWINGGYFIFNKSIFKYIKDHDTVLEKEPLENLAKQGELMAYKHTGFWQCMDTKRDMDYLIELSKSEFPPWTS